MNDIKRAISCFRKGFSCSQAIFSTFSERYGLDRDIALRIASAFGGGIARNGKTCGAVTGAFMVLGLKYGNMKITNNKKKEKTYDLVNAFIDKFKALHGTITCKKLINCDISTLEGRNLALEKNVFIDICPKLVQNSAEILEQML